MSPIDLKIFSADKYSKFSNKIKLSCRSCILVSFFDCKIFLKVSKVKSLVLTS